MDTPSPYSRSSDLSSNDISKVQEEINVYEVAVSSVDAEIQELAKQAAILRHKKHRLLELIAQCRGRITLALRVPDEILAHCFEHCVSGGWYKAPLILSHVCRKWRQAAMTPSVFSRVHLANESRDPVAKTKLWLSRALNTPLNITVDVYAIDSQILSAFDLLVDRADQWTNLDLYTSHISQANDLFSLCIRPIPNLVSLRVYCVDLQNVIQLEADRLAMIGPASIDAPKLRTYEVLTNTFTIQYPTQVSHISLELDSSITALPPLPPDAATTPFILLSDLPSLTSLTITTAFDYRETFNDTTPIIPLPHLEQLTLNSNRASIQILEYIDAPKLRSLRIRSVEPPLSHPYAPTGSALRRFLVRSSPPLTTLELHDVDLPVSDYLECFSLLRSLESLRLHETEIPDEAFSALHGPDAYLPNLVSLDLRWCEQLAGSALVDLVASRRQPPRKPIAFVRVINCAVVKELDVLALARMTTCSIVVKEMDDYCRSKGCCNNARYRQRMRLRHLTELSDKEARLDLVLD